MPSSNSLRPRAFLSYSWTSDERADWIRGLADRLINDGVDVILDQYDLKDGQDKFSFMERMVTDPTVTHVVALSDARYAERADNRAGGVGTETLILTPEVYAEAGQQRVIPVALGVNEDGTLTLPTFLSSRWAINMASPAREADGYEQLLRTLYGRPRHVRPPMGRPPAYITSPELPARRAGSCLRAFADALGRERAIVYSLAQDFVEAVSTELITLQLTSIPDPQLADEAVLAKIKEVQPLRDDVVGFLTAVASHRADDRLAGIVGDLFEQLLVPQAAVPGQSYHRWQFDHYRFLAYDVFLHAAALCVSSHRLGLLASLTDRGYLLPPLFVGDGQAGTATFPVFNRHCEALDEMRNRRLFEGRRLSVTADLVRESTNHPRVTFEDLVSSDLLLFLKSVLCTDGEWVWYPRLIGYASAAPPILRRATHKANFDEAKSLLHVSSGEDLRERFASGAAKINLDRWSWGSGFGRSPVGWLLLDQLDSRT